MSDGKRMKPGETSAFYGGMCAALSVVAIHGMDTIYREIVELGGHGLLEFARREQDCEFEGIRKALRESRRIERVRRPAVVECREAHDVAVPQPIKHWDGKDHGY